MSCSNFNPGVPSTSINSNNIDQGTNRNTGGNEEGKKSVTVLISDTGEITYDEATIQSIIGILFYYNNHPESLFAHNYWPSLNTEYFF